MEVGETLLGDRMKVESYVSMETLPGEEPYFNIRLSEGHVFFEIMELSEHEVRELIDDIRDMMEMQLEVNEKLQSLASKAKGGEG